MIAIVANNTISPNRHKGNCEDKYKTVKHINPTGCFLTFVWKYKMEVLKCMGRGDNQWYYRTSIVWGNIKMKSRSLQLWLAIMLVVLCVDYYMCMCMR